MDKKVVDSPSESQIEAMSELLMRYRHNDFPAETFKKVMHDQPVEREELKQAMRYMKDIHADYVQMRTHIEELQTHRKLALKVSEIRKVID